MPRLNPLSKSTLLLVAATTLTACSTIAGLFPDKQKQYRYSSEIPELEIPPDLTSETIEGAGQGAPHRGGEGAEKADVGREGEEAPAEMAAPSAKKEPAAAKSSTPAATLAQGTDDVPLIEIEEPFAEAWNDVSRALGRLELEVSDQNRSDSVFYVYYGGETKKYEDRGMLGDLAALFTGESAKGKEYRVKLEDKGDFTNIYVLDESGKAVADGPGFELLKKLNEKLQSLDQPESEQAESGK
jgi:uncharacterized lipoprotein